MTWCLMMVNDYGEYKLNTGTVVFLIAVEQLGSDYHMKLDTERKFILIRVMKLMR